MEVTGSTAQPIATAVQVRVQKQVLDTMKAQGAQLDKMLAAVNGPGQGQHIDAFA